MIKLVLFFLIALNEDFSFGSCPQDPPKPPVLNFVMATDKNYIIPTLVAMYSVIKSCKGCIKHFIIFVGSNKIKREEPNSYIETPPPTEGDKEKLRRLANSGDVKVTLVNISEKFFEKTDPLITAYVDRLVCLRVILPEFFQQNNSFYQNASNEHVKLSDYLWLDSDVLT